MVRWSVREWTMVCSRTFPFSQGFQLSQNACWPHCDGRHRLSGAAVPSRASLVQSTSGFVDPIALPNFDPIPPSTLSSGPLTIVAPNGDLIDYVSTNQYSVINYQGGLGNYDFTPNGVWDGSLSMAGLNDGDGYMDFTFLDGPVSAVGGFLNYAPGSPADMFIAVLNAVGDELEHHDLEFSTGGGLNIGENYYIQRRNADIITFRVGRSFAGIAHFAYDAHVPPVPSPLPGLGFVAAFGCSRRLRSRLNRCSAL